MASLAFAVLACGRNATSEDAPEGTPYEVLRAAPPFALETLDGDSLTLEDLADKKAILMNFWASWCAPCRAEIPDLIEIHEAFAPQGLQVLGVTVNDLPRDSRAFVAEMGMPYVSVIGTPAMLEDYGLSPWLPTTLLIKDRQVIREWVGPKTRADFEYPVKVALDMAPPLGKVMKNADASSAGER